ncbi:adenosylmethionine decarboxylase [Aquabacterium sp.]|uniref:adenosylmethionine decarboxylase n=1 Tax=Aquabacterium sp. TaxID=1872578 RepID=UPI0035B394A5
MHGLHLIADLTGCPPANPAMTDAAALRAMCVAAVAEVGLRAVAECFHSFADAAGAAGTPTSGVTGMVLLAESHLAVHTWPELGAVTLDVYVCNRGTDHSAQARRLLQTLVAAFDPLQVRQQGVVRGDLESGLTGPGQSAASLA